MPEVSGAQSESETTKPMKLQLNLRLPPKLKTDVDREFKRQGRKRDTVGERVWRWFLALPVKDRDAICSK